MTLLLGSLTIGSILALLALGVFVSFRVFHFPDITTEGSFTLGASIAAALLVGGVDRKSTRLNSSHLGISYAVFCLKKKKKKKNQNHITTIQEYEIQETLRKLKQNRIDV